MVRKLSSIIVFYRHHCTIAMIVSVLCCLLYSLHKGDAVLEVATKLLTDLLLLYFIFLRSSSLFYYYNLHLSGRVMVAGFLLIDILLFLSMLWLCNLLT